MKELCFFCLIILVFSIGLRSADENSKSEQNKQEREETKTDFGKNLSVSTSENEINSEIDENIMKTKEPSKTDDEVVTREEEAISVDGLNVSQMKEFRSKAEKYRFQTEVNRMMKLIINSLYKNKEIFLRELISNASDALDKVRFFALTNQEKSHDDDDLIIQIKVDKDSKTIHIIDTGIGMTKSELINNLGTIAKSGTSDFIAKVSESKNAAEINDLIGQFGVGFYSSFLVSDRVTVITKSYADHQYIWESDATSFTISRDPRGNTLQRGTEIILHLKEEFHEYLETDVLSNLVHKYSQFINFPIYMWKSSVKNVDEPQKTAVVKTDEDADVENENEKKTVEKTVWDWEIINKSKPIWTRKSSETSDEEYNVFYKSFTKEQDDPLCKTHFTAEGEVSFKAILYVPKKTSPDSNNYNTDKRNTNIKLYVKRVFITDDFDDLMPKYLSFIKGVIDSDDLPLNVSRETLQQHKLIKVIKKKLVRKTLDMIKKMPEDTFNSFWKEYGNNIKMGAIEDATNKNRLAKLIRFWSSHSEENQTSLLDYVSRVKQNQNHIFFIAGMSLEDVKQSPMVEKLLAKKYEVLYLVDPIDEYALQSIPEFEGKKFQNVAKEGFKLDDSDQLMENREKVAQQFEKLNSWLTNDALKDYIEKVEISERLTSSPCVLIATTYGWSGNMERIMKAQSYQKSDEAMANYQNGQKKIMEINPHHPLIKQLKYSFENNKNMNLTRDLVKLLYDTALLRSGYSLTNVASFSKQVDEIVRTSMKIPLDEPVLEDEEILEDYAPETLTEKSETGNLELKTESDREHKILPISFATFRKLLQIEDDEELENDDVEEEENTSEDENNLFDSEEDESENNSDSEDDDETELVEDYFDTKDTNDDDDDDADDEITSEHEDSYEEEETNDNNEEDTDDEEEFTEHTFKKRKLHSITEQNIFKPTLNDHDCDGIPDDQDEDVDNDGLLDHTQDSDWDGDLNHIDEDDDNDGIPDKDDTDSNGDGIPDCRPDSSDNKLRLRFKSKKKHLDSDMDGVPDDSDIDDDEDGIPDILEDSDGNDIPDFLDKDKDINNKDDFAAILAAAALQDHDCDGIPDQYDPDDDNDGYFDKKQDSDTDGILNEYDDDDDNDGIPDSEDPDSNGDGIIDCVLKDSDGDGIPDHIDVDDDNDGIPDLKDPNHPLFNFFMDSDKDGIPDSMDNDDDNDGIPDHRDYDADGDGESDLFPDKDKDGVPDNIDNDMNNDGIPDHMQDRDCDGIPDLIDPDDDNDGYFDSKQDSDNDGLLNEWDDDDDNDGIPDINDPDSNGDGIIDCRPRDSDGDGIPDHLDPDDDNDGIPDYLDPDSMAFLLYKKTQQMDALPASQARSEANTDVDLGDPGDKDCDGIPDDMDLDVDNDGKIDRTQDSDMDGELNHVDEDDDNDGILDMNDPDSNGDGIPDCRRDDFINYKLIKSRSGKIKRVLRIRKQTEEDANIEHQKKSVNLKLIHQQALEMGKSGKIVKKVTKKPTIKVSKKTKNIEKQKITTTQAPLTTKTKKPPKIVKTTRSTKPAEIKKVKTESKKKTNVKPKVVPDKKVITEHKETKVTKQPAVVKTTKKKPVSPKKIKNTVKKSVVKKKNVKKSKEEKKSKHTKKVFRILDHDCDGIPDNKDKDADNDGVDDDKQDSDNDGIVNSIDTDDDNDGISDELDDDANGDGIIDCKPKHKSPKKTVTKAAVNKNKGKPHNRKLLSIDEDEETQSDELEAEDEEIDEEIDSGEDEESNYSNKVTKIPLKISLGKSEKHAQSKISLKTKSESDVDHQTKVQNIKGSVTSKSQGKILMKSNKKVSEIPKNLKKDSDGDGIPDYLEKDSDGDGIPDYKEDENGDGIPDYLEKDSDGDGIPDYEEDEDGDGIPDYLEKDSDGDGIPDYKEDKDGDGIPDYLENDSDGDGIPDYEEDEDGDGIPDYLEKDSDGDGIPDYKEDEDGDGIPDYLEKDLDKTKLNKNRNIKAKAMNKDTDGDGIPDYLEKDSDGDGIPDYKEDEDGDGIPDYLEKDSDGDGIPDYKEDEDGDGIPDYLEKDSDGDGIPDYKEDEDGDGIPDYLEKGLDKTKPNKNKDIKAKAMNKDSDGDGIPDYKEDEDGDGIPDYLEKDSDGDGIPDYKEDEDGDGIPDYLEKDSDGDGIPDYKEDEDGDGIPDYLEKDSDGDGIPDYKEDEDGDGIPDYLEKDSDGDGIPDYQEDEDGNGIPDYLEKDSDGDGIPDYKEDEDGDGIPDYLEKDSDGDGIPDYKEDENGDGIPDYLEKDSDGDGIPDYKEDEDGDGIPDYLEKDSDGDGIPDYKEDEDGDGIPDYKEVSHFQQKEDKDGDGIPDSLEKDSDGDGIPDYKEDEDGNGIPDYLEKDTDGDGIPDYLENDSDGDGIPNFMEDENGDGIPDYLENDSDGDGVPDYEEDEDGDGIPDYKQSKKSKINVTKKTQSSEYIVTTGKVKSPLKVPEVDKTTDSDGDGIPDYQDTDTKKEKSGKTMHCKTKESCEVIGSKKPEFQGEVQDEKVTLPRMIIRQVLQSLENFFGVDE